MQLFTFISGTLLIIFCTWVIFKEGSRKNIRVITLCAILLASLWFNLLLTETNKELAKEVEEEKSQHILSAKLPDITPIIITVTPSPTPAPVIVKEKEEPEERYHFTDNDIYLMARLLCGSKHKDGDGEYDFDYGNQDRYDQISLVLCVVMNRVRSEEFPDSVEGVITQRCSGGKGWQFSAVALWRSDNGEVSDIAIQRVTEWCRAYNQGPMGSQSIPENYLYFSSNGRGVNAARKDL